MVSSFGEKLRRERERRKKPLEEISGTTEIPLTYLEGLEQNEFGTLPGPAFGKLYIRAYAEVLGFDPEPLIEEYDRERERRSRTAAEAAGEADLPRRESAASPPGRRRRRRAWLEESDDAPPVELPAPVEKAAAPKAPPPPSEVAPAPIVKPPMKPPAAPVATDTPKQPTSPAPSVVVKLGPKPVDSDPSRRARRTAAIAMVVFAGLVLTTAWIYSTFDGPAPAGETAGTDVAQSGAPAADLETGTEREAAPEEETPGAAVEPIADPPAAAGTDTELTIEAQAAPTTPDPPDAPVTTPGTLTVRGFGVGRNVVHRRLQGETDQFPEGELAYFSTRVLGGVPGQTVKHVWLREGKWVETINLKLGGSHWRTHSRKTLWGVGEWAVEARDTENRVLARATFTCTPARR